MWICCVLKHKASSSDSCRLSSLIFAVVVAFTQRNKKIPYFCPWGLVVDICCCHRLCCCCRHRVIWCKCLGRSLWGYRHGHMIVVNPVINSWCACARWLMDSSCAALGSRIVRLRTRASLSTFLTVIAKIKRSCACAQWLIVHIARVVVIKDNTQSEMKLVRTWCRHMLLSLHFCCCRHRCASGNIQTINAMTTNSMCAHARTANE